MTPEGKVKAKVLRLLKQYPGLLYDMPVPSGFGKSMLDFNCWYRGKPFVIETKAEGKQPTDRQKGIIAQARRAGVDVFVLKSVGDPGFGVLTNYLEILKMGPAPTGAEVNL